MAWRTAIASVVAALAAAGPAVAHSEPVPVRVHFNPYALVGGDSHAVLVLGSVGCPVGAAVDVELTIEQDGAMGAARVSGRCRVGHLPFLTTIWSNSGEFRPGPAAACLGVSCNEVTLTPHLVRPPRG